MKPIQNHFHCIIAWNRVIASVRFYSQFTLVLERLKNAAIGCHIGKVYANAFGYADDVGLIAPSLYYLKQMVIICEKYAEEGTLVNLSYYVNLMLCYAVKS